MRRFYFAAAILLVLFMGTPVSAQEKSLYEELSTKQQTIVDTVLDEFKRHHLFFLPEFSGVLNLTAATARPDADVHEGGGDSEKDHGSLEDESHQDEHLDIKIARATPDKDGKYHTPTMDLMPGRVYTYEKLYTVLISDAQITIESSEVLENVPERSAAKPDPDFVKDLAERVKGQVTGEGRITLP
jgi:hypothetical protein